DPYAEGLVEAWHLDRMLTSHEGDTVTVLRSSDSTEQAFGPGEGGALDTAAVLAFCGAGNGHVTRLHGQAGNAHALTPPSSATRPRIVNAGALEAIDGRTALYFDGGDYIRAAVSAAFD